MHTSSAIIAFAMILRVAAPLLGAAGPEPPRETITSCAEDLQIPRHGPPGGVGDKMGPLIIKVVPDGTGRTRSVAVKGGSKAAAILVRSWISESTFASRCAGKQLFLQISFIIEGPPIDYPFSWVTFQAPNHFIVHSRARTPHIFPVPDGMEKEKK